VASKACVENHKSKSNTKIREDFTNEKEIQKLVSWLEDVKIRFYKIENREPLKNHSDTWKTDFCKYLHDLKCTRKYSDKMGQAELLTVIDWILNHAISLEYKDNSAQYNANVEFLKNQSSSEVVVEDSTIYNSPEFQHEVESLAQTLQIPHHQDYTVMLKAILELIDKKFSEEVIKVALANKDKPLSLNVVTPEVFPLGFDTGDKLVNECATILRLLYIEDQRKLQTKINELLVAVQNYTANPKTDTSLGKTGR